jgi:hypothetical protein
LLASAWLWIGCYIQTNLSPLACQQTFNQRAALRLEIDPAEVTLLLWRHSPVFHSVGNRSAT